MEFAGRAVSRKDDLWCFCHWVMISKMVALSHLRGGASVCFGGNRKLNVEGGTLTHSGRLTPDASLVVTQDLARNIQTKAGSFGIDLAYAFSTAEFFKNVIEICGANADARVSEGCENSITCPTGNTTPPDPNFSALYVVLN